MTGPPTDLRPLAPDAGRYLELVKRAVLDELYVEHELQMAYLLEQIERGAPVDPERLRDPMRSMRVRAQRLLAERRSGTTSEARPELAALPLAVGRARLDCVETSLRRLAQEDRQGPVVVCGAGRGGIAIVAKATIEVLGLDRCPLTLVDEFVPPPAGAADLNAVRDAIDRFGLLDQSVRFVQGRIDDPHGWGPDAPVALLYLGVDEPRLVAATDAWYPLVGPGGVVVAEHEVSPGDGAPVERVDWSTVTWRKPTTTAHVPVVPEAPVEPLDLSVVVVFYNMRREAERTLHSLTRGYQDGIDDLDYEVIVVENGSTDDQRLGEPFVRSFGSEFRYLDMGATATPSPVPALNRGIGLARGRNLALMIDGAHVLTPGVLRFGMVGLETYAPAVVGTQQWYVGPGQQPETVRAGYDRAVEDALFDDIVWPSDGYRLFDIGHFVGDRDWFDGLWESNCLFVPASLVRQSGPFDESFAMPGGGYANLELYERLASTPGVTSVTILGEGSFHQVHGGTTTNQSEVDARHQELSSYSEHFRDVRGRAYRGHGKPTHYVGAMRPNAMRSRARRQKAANFFRPKDPIGPDGLPNEPIPLPQDTRDEFVESFWNSLAWKQVSWLGRRTGRPPTDLFVYQELISRLHPDWIVETGTGTGGRALYLASICELVGHGTVVSIDAKDAAGRPEHPRLRHVHGAAHDPATATQVREIVGDLPTALVILGSRGSRQRTVAEFELYAPLVPVGSYVVIEDTVVNGHPVWPGFGAGPMEAAKGIVNERAGFAADHSLEKYGLTFNPSGFLKRVR